MVALVEIPDCCMRRVDVCGSKGNVFSFDGDVEDVPIKAVVAGEVMD